MNKRQLITLFLTLFLMMSCSHKRKVVVGGVNKSSVFEAAKQPIYSVNLIKKSIPENLKALTVVYQVPEGCDEFKQELSLLDSVLGEDLIDKKSKKNKTITVHLGQMLGEQVESTIPFNSIIKSLSGAKKHEKARLSAFVRGQSRRTFLKGWAKGHGCETQNTSNDSPVELVP